MIGFLKGVVAGRTSETCTVDVGGVGYLLACSATTLTAIPGDGQSVQLWTHLHVRDDALTLFGFATDAERRMFHALITVSGVGPKVALTICGAFAPEAFRKALATDDVDAITSVPGIGRKTAQRILIDLKEKLQVPDLELVGRRGDAVSGARAALKHLGYSPTEVRKALEEVPPDAGSVEDVVRAALRRLGASS